MHGKNRACSALIALLLSFFLLSMSASAEDITEEGTIDWIISTINQDYATFGDSTRLIVGSGGPDKDSDIVTASPGPFTIYLWTKGWPETVCDPNEDPNIIRANCFIENRTIDQFKEQLVYSAGVLESADYLTGVSFGIVEKRVDYNETQQTVTLSIQAKGTYSYEEESCSGGSDDGEISDTLSTSSHTSYSSHALHTLRFDDGGDNSDSNDGNDDGNGESCTTITITVEWDSGLSQTIPAPKRYSYNTTREIYISSTPLSSKLESDFLFEKYGYAIDADTCTYFSMPLAWLIAEFKEAPCETKRVHIQTWWYEKYYQVHYHAKRGIYWGELINKSFSTPYIDTDGFTHIQNETEKIRYLIVSGNSTKNVSSYVSTPWGLRGTKAVIIEISPDATLKTLARRAIIVLTIPVMAIVMFLRLTKERKGR